jgi:hypothetical protein
MTLRAVWFDEGRTAQFAPDPHYPLGLEVDLSRGQPSCTVSLRYPAPRVGKWIIRCDVCGFLGIVSAAGRADDPHTVRVACKPKGEA